MQPYAGFWQRVKAFAFDYLLIIVYLIVILSASLLMDGILNFEQWLFADRIQAQVSAFLIVTFPVILYFAIGESSVKQATWGKQRMGLKVADHNGDRISFWRAVARTVLKFIPWELSHTLIWEINFSGGLLSKVVNYGLVLVYVLIGLNIASIFMSRTRQSLYDLLSGTFVIEQR